MTLTCCVIIAGYAGWEGFLDFGFYDSVTALAYFALLYALSVMVLSQWPQIKACHQVV